MPRKEFLAKTTITAAIVISSLLTGCATVDQPKVVSDDFVHDTLVKSSNDVYGELKVLNNSSSWREPTVTLPSPVTGCSTRIVSIDYDGLASSFIDDLKSFGFCHVRVVGKAPPQDLILSLHHHHEPLWHVLEDTGVQMGSQAKMDITTESVIISYHGQIADVGGDGK